LETELLNLTLLPDKGLLHIT